MKSTKYQVIVGTPISLGGGGRIPDALDNHDFLGLSSPQSL